MHVCVTGECQVILVGTPRSQFIPKALSAPNGRGHYLSDARFDECRMVSYLHGMQAITHMKSRHPSEPWTHMVGTNK